VIQNDDAQLDAGQSEPGAEAGTEVGTEVGAPPVASAPAAEATSTAAVVLAAGEGSRFEGATHKLLAPLKGRAVVAWAVEAAMKAGFEEVIVVSGAVDLSDVIPAEVTLLQNHDWADGQSRSLQVAVRYAGLVGHDCVVVGLGDQPFVPASAWTAVAAASRPIATAEFGSETRPPVRLHADVWGLLPISGDEGARGLIRRRSELVERIPCDGSGADVDTADDLASLNRRSIPEGLDHGSTE